MSRTYHLGCHDCRVYLWVGQGWPNTRVYLYSTDENIRRLQEFFWTHIGHRLEYQDSEVAGWWESDGSGFQELYGEDEDGNSPEIPIPLEAQMEIELAAARARIAELERERDEERERCCRDMCDGCLVELPVREQVQNPPRFGGWVWYHPDGHCNAARIRERHYQQQEAGNDA